MRRDDAVSRLFAEIKRMEKEDLLSPRDRACEIISFVEHDLKMLPPSVKAITIRGKDFRFGAMCSMRCSCDECNPNYLMNVWEQK